MYLTRLQEKLNEALKAVLPIVAIVMALSFTVAPLPNEVLLAFLLGAVLLVAGMMFFSLGAELSMEQMGQNVGSRLTRTKKLSVIILVSFVLGMLITVSEPDLQVLAHQVNSIPDGVLIWSVAVGVGIFLALAVVRMFFHLSFRLLLLISYTLVLLLVIFAPKDFIAVAFDSGGVTTGPLTVPFIMAFGIGICSARSDREAADDSFGLVALCSVGPILAVMILSILFHAEDTLYEAATAPQVAHTIEMGALFVSAFPSYMKEIAGALLPVVAFFGLFQIVSLRLNRKILIRMLVGLVYTYGGLVIFLTGVNVGFMPAGSFIGAALAGLRFRWLLVPVGMLIGYFIVKAEPAVYVLRKQVESITDGAVTGKALQISLSVGVSVSVGLAMVRVLTGLPLLWLVAPGYLLSLGLSFVTPRIFTAVAFDSGGVASGPMTATFLLPLAEGACIAVGGNVVTDAFGVVALVAMTPLIAIQILGVIYAIKLKRGRAGAASTEGAEDESNYEVIEL